MKNNYLIVAVLLILVGGIGFFVGTKYQQRRSLNFADRRGQFGNQLSGQARGRIGGRQAVGEIIGQDDKSITVKMMDGSSKIVLISDTTSINKAAAGSKDDLRVGQRIAVFGADNTDGSVTAQSIQLNPILRGQPSPVNK